MSTLRFMGIECVNGTMQPDGILMITYACNSGLRLERPFAIILNYNG
ncbi:MAG TPA: hypothetical protein VL947_01745 [Cytophagales bacterium]|nr:hypothetical protein [Cytophagales bacterium]